MGGVRDNPVGRPASAGQPAAGTSVSVGLIGARRLRARAEKALASSGMEAVPIGADARRQRLGRGLDVLVISGGSRPETRISTVRRLATRAPRVAVVVVLESIGEGVARAMIGAGARGVVLTGQLERTLAATVRAAQMGQVSIPQPIRGQIFPPPLSHRETTVLSMVARGQTNAQIAAGLFLAESTVKSHLRSVFAKLGVNSREEAAAAARASDPATGIGHAEGQKALASRSRDEALSVGGGRRADQQDGRPAGDHVGRARGREQRGASPGRRGAPGGGH